MFINSLATTVPLPHHHLRHHHPHHIMLLRSLERFGGYFRHFITVVPQNDMEMFQEAMAYFGDRFIIKAVNHSYGVWYDIVYTDHYTDANYMFHLDSDMALPRTLVDTDFFPALNSTRSYQRCLPFGHPELPQMMIDDNRFSVEYTIGVAYNEVCLGY
jgi:hypothetical protein